MASGTITIEKAYFETLLRRAQFHTSGVDFTTPVNLPTVTIPKLDHDSLLNTAREYANLRRNLYNGGVTDEVFNILINDRGNDGITNFNTADFESETLQTQAIHSIFQPSSNPRQGGISHTAGRMGNHSGHNRNGNSNDYEYMNGDTNGNNGWDDSSTIPDGAIDGFNENENVMHDQHHTRHQQPPKNAQRTVLLTNLPDGVSHGDVVNIVRGGMLLDIYLRSNDRSCAVSFVEEAHARDFYRYVKRNDLYIRSKRIEIRWHDRQFLLLGHVASKVAIGATRNLIIRNSSPKHTEEMIRDDLEHIYNLVVISVKLTGNSVHISTNSIHNSMFARTCMMSRGAYKGSKIDWDLDDCAEPLPRPQNKVRSAKVPMKRTVPITNRFNLLNIDESEDGSLEDSQDTSFHTADTPPATGAQAHNPL